MSPLPGSLLGSGTLVPGAVPQSGALITELRAPHLSQELTGWLLERGARFWVPQDAVPPTRLPSPFLLESQFPPPPLGGACSPFSPAAQGDRGSPVTSSQMKNCASTGHRLHLQSHGFNQSRNQNITGAAWASHHHPRLIEAGACCLPTAPGLSSHPHPSAWGCSEAGRGLFLS